MTGVLDRDLPGDEPVDLGSSATAAEATALVLRGVTEHASGHGLPGTEGPHPDDVVELPESAGLLSRIVAQLRGYSLLRMTPYGIAPAITLGLIFFFQSFDSKAFSVALPFIVRELELDIGDLITLQIYLGVILVFAGMYAGWFADRKPRVPFVAVGTFLSGVFSMVAAFGRSFSAIAAPRLLDDVADQASTVPEFSLMADYYPPESRGRAFALVGTLARSGALLATVLVGAAIELWGWRTALLVFGMPLLSMGVIAAVTLREPKRGYMERKALGADDATAAVEDEPQSFGEAWRSTWAVRTLRRLFISDVLALGSDAVFGFWLIFYLVEVYSLSPLQLSLFGLPGIVARLFGGFIGGTIVDRVVGKNPGRVLTIIGTFQLVGVLGVAGFALQPPIWVLIAFFALNGFGGALVGPASSVVYAQVVPASIRTQGLQMTLMASLPSTILIFPLGGVVKSLYGYEATFWFCVPFGIAGAVLAMTAGSFFELDARGAFAANLANDEWRRAKAAGRGKLLVCRDVDVAYDGVQVLFGVDFDVEEGEIIALLGTNGAGKSTLLRAISGTQEASGGAIVFDGRDVTHMPPHEITGRGVIHMPGGRGVFPGLTVRDNLLLALWMVDDPAEANERLAEVFGIFPRLRDRAGAEASVLSGGEQQQLSLAQAFLAKPRLLLIDELSLGLSPAVVGELLRIVREIHARGVTIVVVEQSVNVALTLAQKAIFMEKGEVRFFGRTDELLARPDILRAVYVKGSGALTAGAPAGARRAVRDQRALGLGEARTVLEVDGLRKSFGGITAVDGVSFNLRDGEVLGLIGPNGAGKTTVFEMISGFQSPDSGIVRYQGNDITDEPPEVRARQGLVRRFQDARLFPSLTVFETLLVALDQQLEVRSTLLNAAGAPRARRAERRQRERAERLIELLELGSYRDKFIKELSTGLRRIVDLACVLAAEPHVLLLDEPSSGIAQAETEALGPLLRRIQFESGCSILVIEHDMPLISAVSDELIALDQGAVITRGTPEAVLNDERVIESYLGTDEAAVKRSGRS